MVHMLGTTAKMEPWLRKTGLFQNRSREREVRWSFWCSHWGLRSWHSLPFKILLAGSQGDNGDVGDDGGGRGGGGDESP